MIIDLKSSDPAQIHYFYDLNLNEISAVCHFWVWACWNHDLSTWSLLALLLTQRSVLVLSLICCSTKLANLLSRFTIYF